MTASIHSTNTFYNIDMSANELNIPLQIMEAKFQRIVLSGTRHIPSNRFLETSLHCVTKGSLSPAQSTIESESKGSSVNSHVFSKQTTQPTQTLQKVDDCPSSSHQYLTSQKYSTTFKRKRDIDDVTTESIRKFYGYDDIGNVFAAHRRQRNSNRISPLKKYRAVRRNSVLIRPECEGQNATFFPDTQRALDALGLQQSVRGESDCKSSIGQMQIDYVEADYSETSLSRHNNNT
jgi:hypothetical protein